MTTLETLFSPMQKEKLRQAALGAPAKLRQDVRTNAA